MKEYQIPYFHLSYLKIKFNGDFDLSNRKSLSLQFLISPECLN
ncbi:hypothetical protein EW14_0169 [Prochlorococcus sp. MIT 0604]|nr:hypothetical protein EW14_0169 [Prochlorococcus sp. MIT 0604]